MSSILTLFFLWLAWQILKGIIKFFSSLSSTQSKPATLSLNVTCTTRTPYTHQKSVSADSVWVSKDKSVTVAGYAIPKGMVYVGKDLVAGSGWGVEAALINPDLPINKSSPDKSGQYMSYWPSYTDINPASRAAYLEWLADGCKDPSVNIGYVFLYFYGLERRVLFDTKSTEVARGEIDQVLRETERLLSIYSSSHSFQSYATRFLNVANAKHSREKFYLRPAPNTAMVYEYLPLFKLALAQMVADSVPLSADWAIFLTRSDPELRLRSSARRCKDEFDRLFKIYYAEKFGNSMVLAKSNTKFKIDYNPASPSLRGAIEFGDADLWDASIPKAFLKQLRGIADICMDELDPYSRFIAKGQQGSNSIEALALYPKKLLEKTENNDLSAIEEWRKKSLGDNKYYETDYAGLAEEFPILKSEEFGKKESLAVAQLFFKFGIGIEPDIRFWAHWPGDGKIVLFELPKDAPIAPSSMYSAAVAILHLASAVMLADGAIAPEEERHLEQQLENWLHLDQPEMIRLRAHNHWLVLAPQSFSWLTKRIQLLGKKQLEPVGKFLVNLAQSDGVIKPEEVRALTKIYGLLGLDPQDFYKDAHIAATEPVKVESPLPQRKRGYAVPPKPFPKDNGPIDLDMERIKEKMAETAAVSVVLSSIFSDENDRTARPIQKTESSGIVGLDNELSAFVRILITKSSWTREELELKAAENKLMLDGTLDTINDAFYVAHNRPLFEGDDVIEINNEILKEIPA